MTAQYDVHKDPHKNIALPDSLLSRFDLLFVVTDDVDEKRDRLIADHVLRMHRYLQPGVEEGTPVHDNLSQSLAVDAPASQNPNAEEEETSPFEKYNPLLHVGIGAKSTGRNPNKKKEVLSVAFIKKYIQYAKSKPSPQLTKDAADEIVEAYANLRNEEAEQNQKRVSSAQYKVRNRVLISDDVTDVASDGPYPRDADSSLNGACESATVTKS